MALFDIAGVNPPYPNGLTPLWVAKINTLETTATDDQTAAEIRALVEGATDSNVFTDADHTNLGAIKVEGGGVVVTGTADPTSGGANTGDDSIIGGEGNHTNSGPACIIGGEDNNTNSGGTCIIGGEDNDHNSGDACIIGGEDNSYNSGDSCIIGGEDNTFNSGDECIIVGKNNIGNFGTHSTIGGKVASGSTQTATSGTSAASATNLVTKISHGVTADQPLRFTTLTGGSGLSTSILYYARDILTDTFAVALTPGGSAVGITGDYSVANYIANAVNYGNFNTIAGEDNEGNSGSWCNISGDQNYSNSGSYSSISGYNNHSNSGHNCQISGSNHYSNSGIRCQISGNYNHTNLGHYCSISGYQNRNNSGDYCQISGYNNFTSTGNYCQISGEYNYTNTGTHCSISGRINSGNDGDYCSISGNNNYSNSGNYCSISGRSAGNNALDYARVHGGNNNARLIDLVAQINSVSTTATELLLGGTGGSRIVIPDQSAWACEIHFVAKTATGANASMQRVHGLLVRDVAATTWAAGVAETQVNIGTSNATFAVSGDDTNEALKLTVTAASGTVRCVANIKLTQVDY